MVVNVAIYSLKDGWRDIFHVVMSEKPFWLYNLIRILYMYNTVQEPEHC